MTSGASVPGGVPHEAAAQVAATPSVTGHLTRRLVTALHMDIVGYTRLIAADDVGTLARIRRLRVEIVEPELARRGGRLVQSAGDALLLTFDSILGAVEFAIEMQGRLRTMNLATRPDEPMNVRIGIEISDTIADQTDLHGDGIIVAVRLQAACPPGGLCVSRTIYDHVEGRVGRRFHALGPLALKNVNRPVEAFCLRAEDLDPEQFATSAAASDICDVDHTARLFGRSPTKADPASPPRNSIAVPPFVNFGRAVTREYFADGVIADTVAALAFFPNRLVIARNPSFSYEPQNVDVCKIDGDLGVHYVGEGRIMRARDRFRILAPLASAPTGPQIWAEEFDAELTDVSLLSDAICQRIVRAMSPQSRAVERDRMRREPTKNRDASDYYFRSIPFWKDFSTPTLGTALRVLAFSMRLDPAIATAMAAAAAWHFCRHDQDWSATDIDDDKGEGLGLAPAALWGGAADVIVLCLAKNAIVGLGADYVGPAELLDRATEPKPNYPQPWMRIGIVRVYLDDPDTAFRHSGRPLLKFVRRLYRGLQSLPSLRRMVAKRRKARALRLRFSQSLPSRRQRPSHFVVRSTIHILQDNEAFGVIAATRDFSCDARHDLRPGNG